MSDYGKVGMGVVPRTFSCPIYDWYYYKIKNQLLKISLMKPGRSWSTACLKRDPVK